MKETLTAQEFALYIGQLIEYPDTDDSLIRATLTGVSKTDGLETTHLKQKDGISGDYLAFKSNGNHNSDALHAKLILRPLSDMTDSERIEFSNADGTYNYISDEDRIGTSENILKSGEFRPAAFAYLLSKGFDLFNWIEEGKAISKTAQNCN